MITDSEGKSIRGKLSDRYIGIERNKECEWRRAESNRNCNCKKTVDKRRSINNCTNFFSYKDKAHFRIAEMEGILVCSGRLEYSDLS